MPCLDTSNALDFFKNGLEMRKLWAPPTTPPTPAPKSWGVKNWDKTTHRTLQAGSWAPQKFLVCCSVAITVQRWFVKWTRNEKVRSFESRRGPKRGKKTAICKLKSLFFFWLFFHYSFSFALRRWFLELDVVLSQHFKPLKMKHRWQRSRSVRS
jgi:hypothetical protein